MDPHGGQEESSAVLHGEYDPRELAIRELDHAGAELPRARHDRAASETALVSRVEWKSSMPWLARGAGNTLAAKNRTVVPRISHAGSRVDRRPLSLQCATRHQCPTACPPLIGSGRKP